MSLLRMAASMMLVISAAGAGASASAQQPIGLFDAQTDVGTARPGSATYDASAQRYTVSGSGQNMWLGHDDFHFLWKRMAGDFILTARAHFEGPGVEPHRKIGWTIRTSLDPGSPHVTAAVHGNGLVSLQNRRSPGAETVQDTFLLRATDVVQLERRGGTYIMSVARFGDTLTSKQVSGVELGDTVYVGLFVCAHNDTVTERATFDNVRITRPAPEGFRPYRDYIGGNLEVLDVATGERRIVYTVPDAIQAPNWTRDGKALIYNRNGHLYRFDLASGQPTEIDTGIADDNNNDHVLSFDGSMLGISHFSKEDGGNSIVFTLPVEGGTPHRVTAQGPSYLHGWSPDGKHLIYTGGRGGVFSIYRIAVEGGEETALTHGDWLDDGPEYSPDGRTIYFNSTRAGLMQLWRMDPDGGNPQRLTDDAFNDWFPHVSPDGHRIVFLSYLADVPPAEHPWYRPVYIRIMPADGGEARVLAYLYGGQGTINVPSWSPDGTRIAFVSNTRMD